MTKAIATSTAQRPSAIASLASRMGVEATGMFLTSLKKVAFKEPNVSDEQLMALVVVANQYHLNPFTRELYAFPDDKTGGIVPIVSVDGWYRIINEHPQFDGLEYLEGVDEKRGVYGECTIYRKDRQHPTRLREYLNEVRRNTGPWKQHEGRMLRHKTIIQTARVAFGFAGIYDQDEGERILAATREPVTVVTSTTGTARLQEALAERLGPPLTQENVVSTPQPVPDSPPADELPPLDDDDLPPPQDDDVV